MNETPPETLRALTGLRFWAALHVLLFHAAMPRSGLTARILAAGPVSVSLFFALSGFILAYTYLRDWQPRRAWPFWGARFARIYPIYLLGILVYAVFVMLPVPPKLPGADAITPKALTASLFLVQSWSRPLACAINCPAWSLSDEAFFYLVFPALAFVLLRAKRHTVFSVAVIMGLLAALLATTYFRRAGQLYAPYLPFYQNPLSGWNPLVRLPEFIFGVAVGLLALQHRVALLAKRTLWPAVLILSCLGILFVYSEIQISAWTELSPAILLPLFAALILSLGFGGHGIQELFGNRFAVRLGEMSYALYILHYPLMLIYTRAEEFGLVPVTLRREGLLLELAIIFAASYAAFFLVEQPARHGLRRAFKIGPLAHATRQRTT